MFGYNNYNRETTNQLQSAQNIQTENYVSHQQSSLGQWLRKTSKSSNNLRIGLWGTTAVGKTTYLTMLFSQLEDSQQWDIVVDKKTRQFIERNLYYLEEEHLFPPPTSQFKDLDILSYTLIPQNHPTIKSRIMLDFIDAPGEFYENIMSNDAQVIDAHSDTETMDIVDYLVSCDGIIFLFDPQRTNQGVQGYSTIIRNLFFELKERSKHPEVKFNRLPQYMAFCITKIDREEFWNQGENSGLTSRELTEKIIGKTTLHKLENNYCMKGRYNFFSLSSIGRYRDEYGYLKEAIIYPEETPAENSSFPLTETVTTPISRFITGKNPVQTPQLIISKQPKIKEDIILQPIGVLEPINWIIQQIQNPQN